MVRWRYPLLVTYRHERADVVARVAVGHLGEVVSAVGEELSARSGHLRGEKGRARHLDHCTEAVLDRIATLSEDWGGWAVVGGRMR